MKGRVFSTILAFVSVAIQGYVFNAVVFKLKITIFSWHLSLWFLDDRLPNKLFDQSALKQFIFALSIFLLILSWVGIGYLIDWVLFDLPSDNEIQPMIDQNRTATKYEEVKSEIKPPSYDTSESENTSDGNHSNEDDEIELGGNSNDTSDVNQMIECISSNNSSNPASSETKKDD